MKSDWHLVFVHRASYQVLVVISLTIKFWLLSEALT